MEAYRPLEHVWMRLFLFEDVLSYETIRIGVTITYCTVFIGSILQ